MRFKILLFLFLAANILTAQLRWRPLLNSPVAGGAGRHDDVFFINSRIGWMVNGDHRIYKTIPPPL